MKKVSPKRNIERRKLKLILGFLVNFNLLAVPLYLVLFLGVSFFPLQVLIAQLTTDLLKAQGHELAQSGHIITANIGNVIHMIEVSWDSTGWKSLYALFALTMAAPVSSLKSKFRFLLFGLPLVFILNLTRIVTTISIAVTFGFEYFDFVHTLLWREGLIITVILIWYFWLKREKNNIRLK